MQDSSVLMIGWEYPPHNSGGLGVACEGMTKALSEQNTNIYFTLPYSQTIPIDHMELINCAHQDWDDDSQLRLYPPFSAYSTEVVGQMHAAPVDRHVLQALPQSQLETKVGQYAETVTIAGTQLRTQFEGIHAHDWMSFPAALRLSKKTGKPYIAHIHSTEFDRVPHGFGSAYITKTEYEGLRAADKIIAVSYYTKRLLETKYSIPSDKISVVHNGITPLQQSSEKIQMTQAFAPHRPVIAFMGRLTMQKGTEYFLQLARSVLQKLPTALFVIAGDGDMYHELLFKTAASRLTANVVFSGFVREKQKATLLDRADVFVMPSLSEPFGLVALEAAQRHTPVIISKNAGVSEILPGSIRVDFWDIDRMSAAIVRLVENKTYARSIRKSQLENLQQASWQQSALRIKAVYREVFAGSK